MNFHHHLKLSICLAALGMLLSQIGCNQGRARVSTSDNLQLVGSYPVRIKEPSGLSLSKDNKSLWTVSDKDGQVYQIDLQGAVLSYFPSGYDDLEAITTIDEQHLAFIAERERKIVIAQKDGTILQEAAIELFGSKNAGPEALTYDEAAEQFHIMQEKPGTIITMNRQLEEVSRQEIDLAKDYSSISFDSTRKHIWVLSDESRSIQVLDEHSKVLEQFSVDIEQMEGIAIDHNRNLVYIISDPLETLFVLQFEPF